MSDLTRYEKELAQKLKQLPVPNEDASWEDMSNLLDESNDKGAPPYRKNIVLGSLIAALLIGSLWIAVNKYQSINNRQIKTHQQAANEKGTDASQNYNQQSNTNDELSNKETITNNKKQITTYNNKLNGSATDINETTTQGNHDQKQSTINKQLKTIGQTANNSESKSNQQNNKEQITTYNSKVNSPATDINETTTTQGNHDQKQSTIDKQQPNIIGQTADNNESKSNQQNNKEQITTTKEINSNKPVAIHKNEIKKSNIDDEITDQNNDQNTTYTKKTVRSNRIIKNKAAETNANNDLASNDQSLQNEKSITKNNSLTVSNTSTRNKAKHNVIAKSGSKKSSKNNDAISNSDASINTNNIEKTGNNEQVITSDLPENNNTVKVNTSSKISNNTATATHVHSIAAVSTKKNKKYFQKKNNITASTKSKTQFNMSSSTAEDIEDNIDTAKLIKIGTYALARKKAKHLIIKKDISTVKPLVVIAKDSSATAKKKDDNKKQLHISVGIGEQQAIRLTCDCVYPDNAYTTSSLATDYIPSVYIKIQPAKKWFVQAEFKYKAPQYIQEQLYRDNISNQPLNYTTATSVLKKVYYNQIPISFDYVIIPNLSVGVGMIYNNFAGQVSQNDVRKKLYGTAADSSISSSTVTSTNGDSLLTFTKNSFQGLIEAQYKWRRFTFGIRYAIGLQPYLKYNNPNVTYSGAYTSSSQNAVTITPSYNAIEKKNDALTIFIHFELWDHKRK